MMGVTFKEEKPRPLTMEMETAKGIIISAVNRARQECGLPSFLMEGIISEIHSQITSQAKVEMMNDFDSYLEELKKENEKKQEEEKEGEEL